MTSVILLSADGTRTAHDLHDAPALVRPAAPSRTRIAYAAAHVVPRVTGENVPGAPADIDWDATLAFRHHVWSWQLGVADAMDTAQRNMGLDPPATRELIERSAAEAATVGGALVVGVNTDHIAAEAIPLDDVIAAYVEQLHHAEDHGAGTVLMASRHLARAAQGADDYRRVYAAVLEAARAPVILHWLGPAFDPNLAGYFGSTDPVAAADVVIDIIADSREQVTGIKMSLLDDAAEIALRARLPRPARMFTGDDFHYVDLIAGDGTHASDALLGAFAACPPNAAVALQALDKGDVETFRTILGPTEALARTIFEAPTYHYKTGVAFLSWLNGHQPAFSMIGGMQGARSLPHLSRVIRLADAAGALEQPELAAQRWSDLLRVHGIEPARVGA